MQGDAAVLTGTVVKLLAGFYYVATGEGVYTCNLRGKFRHSEETVFVGDRVEVKVTDAAARRGVIDRLLPRHNFLFRPPVANVEVALVVTAVCQPEPNFKLLDRFLVLTAAAGLEPVVIFNKADLNPELAAEKAEFYRGCGYRSVAVSVLTGEGVEEIAAACAGRIAVMAGPSGVGKSSLLNALIPGLNLPTGEVSRKTGRGRHTTRHVELLSLPGGGMVADTPGFSSLNLPKMEREELAAYFPEFRRVEGSCRFHSCLHYREPDCCIREAVAAGLISSERYRHYVEFLEEVIEQERSKW